MFVCGSVCVYRLFVCLWSGGEGRTTGLQTALIEKKSNNINKTAVSVTRVTFAVTGDRHRRGTQSPRIPLKSASNCAAGLEVLSFLPLGVTAVGQMHPAFSGTLGRIRPIS